MDAGLGAFADVAVKQGLVYWHQVRIHFLTEHLPAGHAGVECLVGMQHIIVFVDVGYVIRHQFVIIVQFFPVVVVLLIEYLLFDGAVHG